jgi:predicted peroxiredoxin
MQPPLPKIKPAREDGEPVVLLSHPSPNHPGRAMDGAPCFFVTGVGFPVAHFARTKSSSGCELLVCAQNNSQDATVWQERVRGCEITGTSTTVL